MKRVSMYLFLFLSLQFISVSAIYAKTVSGPVCKKDGDREGNGGDIFSIQFVSVAEEVISILENNHFELAQDLARVLYSAKINSKEALILNGKDVSAINYPDCTPQVILISQAAWRQEVSIEVRRRLVLHELLYLLGINDDGYKVSKNYNLIGLCDFYSPIKQAIEKKFNKDCRSVSKQELESIEQFSIDFNRPNFYWKYFDLNGFSSLKFLTIKGVYLSRPELYKLLYGVRQLERLDLSSTVIRLWPNMQREEEFRFWENISKFTKYSQLKIDDIAEIVEKDIQTYINLDNLKVFKYLYRYLERYRPVGYQRFNEWINMAELSNSSKIINFFENSNM